MNYTKTFNNVTYYSMQGLIHNTQIKRTTIESYRKSGLISSFRNGRTFYYPMIVINELKNISGFEKLRNLFKSKVFSQYNITFHNTTHELKVSLLSIQNKITDSKKKAICDMIKYSDSPFDLEYRFHNYYSKKAPGGSKINFQLRYGVSRGNKLYFDKLDKLKSSQSLQGFKLRYGDKEGTKLFNDRIEKTKNTLENFINRHGKEEGTKKYNDYRSKNSKTLENFIKWYGEEDGRKKRKELLDRLSMSKEKFIIKYGKEKGLEKYNNWRKKIGQSKENLIKLYGEKEGMNRHKKLIQHTKNMNSKDFYIEKYGKDDGDKIWNGRTNTKENYILRYGEKSGTIKWNNWLEKTKKSEENFIKWYGEEEGLIKWDLFKKKCSENNGYLKASTESLEIFEPLTEYLLENNIDFADIFYGIENSFEFQISGENNEMYSYDYTITTLKLIFEYNGSHVHPSKEKLTETEWNEWCSPWNKETANEKYEKDRLKIQTAEKEGFTVIEIWDYDDKNEAITKCINLINEKI